MPENCIITATSTLIRISPLKHARTGPVLDRFCQHRASTGPVLAHNDMFTGIMVAPECPAAIPITAHFIMAIPPRNQLARIGYLPYVPDQNTEHPSDEQCLPTFTQS